ncbi:hypothetical protein HUB98_27720 [Paenibacillus barcinonensis]|uniref:Uncharacterized protein n=2 Tax=Paenibacillus barcinonensis TaxID=198119 RepID=A0A2V4W9K7_PAEBA|nr:hypothetical protein [Paenibacillus barcinonensis]PYE52251.1 hypothetical protein DFQ00_101184 [Paenibacillus barcinonensis]QKS59618.1 hypothetical protein HUB98_27720 [Paenibacillus barcinonensis]
MMIFLVALALLGMFAFYSLLAYFLIRLISKKGFKVTLTKYEILEMMTWLALICIVVYSIKSWSSTTILPAIMLIIPLRNMRISNRKHRERITRESAPFAVNKEGTL